MQFKMIVATLPKPGTFLCLHKHTDWDNCIWSEKDRQQILHLREAVRQLYLAGPAASGLCRPDVEVLFDASLTVDQAVSRVLPYYAEATPRNQRRIGYLGPLDDVELLKPAGEIDEPFGLRSVVVATTNQELTLPDEVLAVAGASDLASLETRSNRQLAKEVSDRLIPGTKVLLVPAECHVRVAKKGRREIVTEVPKTWE